MHVLVYGYKGWIGRQVCQILDAKGHTWIGGECRVDDVDGMKLELQQCIGITGITHVFCVIGRTHGPGHNTIDYLEEPGKLVENIRDNLFAPIALAMLCQELNIHMTYIGTGCIFNNVDSNGNDNIICSGKTYDEQSLPDFFGSSYSIVKGFTDRLMHQLTGCLNLRIRMPITGTPDSRNFITKITGYAQICSIDNSMTVLDDLLPIALDMMQDKLTGTYNLVNPGVINHNQILNMYKELVDPVFKWQNMTLTEQDKLLACKRSNNILDVSKLRDYIASKPEYCDDVLRNFKSLDITCSIRRALIEYHKHYKPNPDADTDNSNGNGNDDGNDNGNGNEMFKNKVILVTGGCGFIGSNFINYMLDKYKDIGLKIVNIDALYYCASEQNIHEWIRNKGDCIYKFIKCNIRQREFVEYVFREEKPDYVVHFAAQSHVDNSFNGALSMDYTLDNVFGTHVMMECCRQYIVNGGILLKIIHVSTDEVYGESMLGEESEKTEQSLLCPTNPYAATKAGAEMIVMSYKHSFGLPVIISRGNNVYGYNQFPEKLIPKWVGLLRDGKKLTIAGKGEQVRSWLWVDDVSRAFDKILIHGTIGEVYNIGSCEEYSVMDVANIMLALIHGNDIDVNKYIEYIADRPFNDKRYFISNDKLYALGWKPEINFTHGLSLLLFTPVPDNRITV